jgi:pSer/pThr/pTyr-binding forkhead associated (FHA) protein
VTGTIVELLVLEGEDAGRLFTLTRDEVQVARINPSKAQPGAIVLMDPTVSLRQATIHTEGEEHFLEHHPDATNPTTLNGMPVIREQFLPGDRIGMGRVLLEARERPNTQHFGRSPHDPITSQEATGPRDTTPMKLPEAMSMATPLETESRPIPGARGQVTVLTGNDGMSRTIFPVDALAMRIGRSSQCEITIPEGGVSRLHAELVLEGDDFVILHRSGTNSTSVNGNPVSERMTLASGDHIQLADRVMLRFDQTASISQSGRAPASSLWSRMEEEVLRNRQIEEEFGAFGSFLDIDVVGSFAMKAHATSPGYIVVSFERWRAWVESILERFDGEMLNSNGDELMCFFEAPLQAVRAADALLIELEEFNAQHNLLDVPFRLRMGIHTGHSLVDRLRGVAYSEVLDIAGHLQKACETNGLLISSATREHIPEDLPFAEAEALEAAGVSTYRLAGPLESNSD